ncbi:unnamed protein product [Moneuplotes crassus]|uniref:Uncharacterized protein n=1 Tax=Euplotes crassus TaxID=5936 RepID=A0AAD1XTG4_EUPCR|nr:unnamed protein product [Moneuplotes crassus]
MGKLRIVTVLILLLIVSRVVSRELRGNYGGSSSGRSYSSSSSSSSNSNSNSSYGSSRYNKHGGGKCNGSTKDCVIIPLAIAVSIVGFIITVIICWCAWDNWSGIKRCLLCCCCNLKLKNCCKCKCKRRKNKIKINSEENPKGQDQLPRMLKPDQEASKRDSQSRPIVSPQPPPSITLAPSQSAQSQKIQKSSTEIPSFKNTIYSGNKISNCKPSNSNLSSSTVQEQDVCLQLTGIENSTVPPTSNPSRPQSMHSAEMQV